jgi:hypothetical protein
MVPQLCYDPLDGLCLFIEYIFFIIIFVIDTICSKYISIRITYISDSETVIAFLSFIFNNSVKINDRLSLTK